MRNDSVVPTQSGRNEVKTCRLCGKRLPVRNNQVNFACQRMQLCRSCYRPHGSTRSAHRKDLPGAPDEFVEFEGGAEVFNPGSPWEWYEAFFPENER